MDQLKKLYSSLNRQQLTAIVLVVLVTGVGLAWFVKWNHNRDFKPLFTGMSPEDAAAVVAKIKETGVEHQLGENGTSVLVPSAKVDEIRLELAAAGLPKTGRVGFELFDRNNLGITDFTEHVNYRRALEGELERSIKALNVVDQARVHLTFPKDSVFVDYREPAKASVLVSTRAGSHLTPQNVLAISNLVGSAVEGLSPDAVSILDMQGNLLNRPRKHLTDDEPSEAILDYKHQVEKDLVSKVESTLEPLLGEGRFRVGISADCDFSTSEQSEEVLDPTKSAMVTSQKSEDAAGSAAQQSGVPGTQSNGPRAAPPRANGSGINSTRRTESTSFETSKLVRHTKMPQGSVKRISASLLLDQDVSWEGKGKARHRVFIPPSPEKIKAINDVIAGVIGLDTARGDKLVIESLPFSQNMTADPGDPGVRTSAPPATALEKFKADPKLLYGVPAAALVLIGAGYMFLRRRRLALLYAKKKALADAAEARERAQLEAAIAAANKEEEEANTLKLPAVPKALDSLRIQVREFVRKDPQLAADVLRSWIDEPPVPPSDAPHHCGKESMRMRCRVADHSQSAEPIIWRNAGSPAPVPTSPGRDLIRSSESSAANPEEIARLQAQLAESERRRQAEVQQARQEGFAEGVRQARAEGEAELRAAMERVTATLTGLASTKRRIRNDAEAELLKLSLAIARRVIHREIALDPEALAGVVHAALQKLQHREVSRVRVFPAGAETVRLAIERAGGPVVDVFLTRSLRTGDLLFETTLGQLDASVDSQLQEIGRGLADRLALR